MLFLGQNSEDIYTHFYIANCAVPSKSAVCANIKQDNSIKSAISGHLLFFIQFPIIAYLTSQKCGNVHFKKHSGCFHARLH